MKRERILCSVSGGETSAMMAYIINKQFADKHDIVYVFANTSREREETLVFLDNMRKHWGLDIVWVEAVVHHGAKKSSTHRITSFEKAVRDGSVFEQVIAKYGIPNKGYPHCTRELKTRPIESYARSLGWKKGSYKIAIGYRADELQRVKWEKEKADSHWYLLPRLNIKKDDVKAFFAKQPFQLGLREHEGNCKLCYKKSKRKLLTQILEDPDTTQWINNMEIKYGTAAIPKNRPNKEKMPFKFFRGYESIADLIEQSKQPFNLFVEREYSGVSEFDAELDFEDECSKSCEPFK